DHRRVLSSIASSVLEIVSADLYHDTQNWWHLFI
ncbi:hypothetical protein GNI_090400, partial [Gregarina niphandrodes]